MDDVDRTNQDLEFLDALTKKGNLKKEAEPKGYCLYCYEPLLDSHRRWCNAECRDAWEKEQRLKNGLKK